MPFCTNCHASLLPLSTAPVSEALDGPAASDVVEKLQNARDVLCICDRGVMLLLLLCMPSTATTTAACVATTLHLTTAASAAAVYAPAASAAAVSSSAICSTAAPLPLHCTRACLLLCCCRSTARLHLGFGIGGVLACLRAANARCYR